jgi:hypothetical protein
MNWRFGYALICLVYAAWVVYLGLDNFAKVYGEYQRARESRQPAQVEKIARQELIDQCRREAKRSSRPRAAGDAVQRLAEDACRSFPDAVLAERKNAVKEQFLAEEKLFRRKLVLFSVTFGIFFVVLPLGLLYLLLSFFTWLFRDMKFIK